MSVADVMASIKERRRRRKVVYIGEDWIRKLIQMPEDVFIERIDYDFKRQSFVIVCGHPDWPVVEEFCEPPSAIGYMSAVYVKAKDLHLKTEQDIILMNLHIDWKEDNVVHDQ